MRLLILAFLSALTLDALALEQTALRLGIQASGTLAWELALLQNSDDFKKTGLRLETQTLASAESGKLALQADAVDIIVSDWLWVAKMRSSGSKLSFYPYSTLSGALVVPDNSPIHQLEDLKGKRLGVAGGELDKNWLLLVTLAKIRGLNLSDSVEKTFGAPPLIAEQLKLGRLDAMLNYWHFATKLETQGYRKVLDGKAILQGLGINKPIPTLGYVFKDSWARENSFALTTFFDWSRKAKNQLCQSDSVWQQVITLTEAADKITQDKLRSQYCEGVTVRWGSAEQQAAEQVYQLLRSASHNQITGTDEQLPSGTFWQLN